jgi:hypothetical protein
MFAPALLISGTKQAHTSKSVSRTHRWKIRHKELSPEEILAVVLRCHYNPMYCKILV